MPKQLPPLHVLEEMLQRGQRKEVNDIIGMNLFPRVEQIVGSKDAPSITGILINFDNFKIEEQC